MIKIKLHFDYILIEIKFNFDYKKIKIRLINDLLKYICPIANLHLILQKNGKEDGA